MANPKKIIIFIIIIVILFVVSYLWYQSTRVTYDAQGIPNGMVSYEFVSSRPEAKLYYPNGKVFSQFGQPQKEKNDFAAAGIIMTSDDPPEKIYAWYKDWLVDRGWRRDEKRERIMGSTNISVKKYIKGERELFQVAIDDPKQLSWTLGKQVPKDKTVFEFIYIIR